MVVIAKRLDLTQMAMPATVAILRRLRQGLKTITLGTRLPMT